MTNNTVASIDYADPMQLMSVFYQKIVELKNWIEAGDLSVQVAEQLQLKREPSNEEIAEAISLRLQHWIEKTRLQASKVLTDREAQRIDEALYVMAVLADELFIIELNWPGQKHWEMVLLEQQVFNTCFAGEKFFYGIQRLLQKRTLDSQQQQLVAVYLFSLRLGFAGRFREQPKKLNHFRQQLFKRISHLKSDQTRICEQGYRHIKSSREEQRLAPLTNWYRTMALGSIVYAALSWGVWWSLVGHWGTS